MRMNASIFPRLCLLGAVSILVFAAPAAMAQNASDSSAPSSSATVKPGSASDAKTPKKNNQKSGDKADTTKTSDNSDSDSKKEKAPAKAPSGYATEAEARAHCRTAVVWVDGNHFNHYPGSREYGKKPGSFGCE
jgi:cytoskeletal protein RodZ